MKIWIDITNSPHVHLFRHFIKEVEKEHEVLITTRDFAYIRDMVELYDIDAHFIGAHGGKELEGKLEACLDREQKLLKFLKNEKRPDIFIGKCSVEGTRIAYGLGIKKIVLADNEYGYAMNNLTLPLSDLAIVPKAMSMDKVKSYGAKNIVSFNGVCEIEHLKGFEPDKSVIEELGIDTNQKLLTMRTGPLEAHYFKEKGTNLVEYIRDLDYQVVALPRNGVDSKAFKKAGVIQPESGVDALSLIHYSDVFLGEGGSMNREAALLGTPTISCYPQELLGVDKFLIEKGILKHSLNKQEIVEWIEQADKVKSMKLAEKVRTQIENPIDTIKEVLGLVPEKIAVSTQ